MASSVLTDRLHGLIIISENGGCLLIGCCHIRVRKTERLKYNKIDSQLFQSDSWGWTDTVHI